MPASQIPARQRFTWGPAGFESAMAFVIVERQTPVGQPGPTPIVRDYAPDRISAIVKVKRLVREALELEAQ
jgi:hypothetical protein